MDLDFRRLSDSSIEVFNAQLGMWERMTAYHYQYGAEVAAALASGAESGYLLDFEDVAINTQASPGLEAAIFGGSRVDAPFNPDYVPVGTGEPWYDAMLLRFPNRTPYDRLGVRQVKGDRPGELIDIPATSDTWLADWNAEREFAETMGIQGVPPDSSKPKIYTKEEVEADMPDGWTAVYQGTGKGFKAEPPATTEPNEHPSPEGAKAWGRARGMANPVEQWTGTGWIAVPGEKQGQIYDTESEARANEPAGFRTVQLNNGMWMYERLPVIPEERITSLDQLITKTWVEKGPAAAMELDAYRDAIESKRVTKQDAMEFAARFGNEDGSNWVELSELYLGYTASPTFAGQLQDAAFSVNQARSESLEPLTQQQILETALNGAQPGGGRQTAALNAAGIGIEPGDGSVAPPNNPFSGLSGDDVVPGSQASAGPFGEPSTSTVARIQAQDAANAAVAAADTGDPEEDAVLYAKTFDAAFAKFSTDNAAGRALHGEFVAAAEAKATAEAADIGVSTPYISDDGLTSTRFTLNEDGTFGEEVTQFGETEKQYAQRVKDAKYQENVVIGGDGQPVTMKGGYEVAKAAGTNFATNDATGERIELTEADYIPSRRVNSKGGTRSMSKSSMAARQAALTAAPTVSAPRAPAKKANDGGAALQAEIDASNRFNFNKNKIHKELITTWG
jgi:hypothetical protein